MRKFSKMDEVEHFCRLPLESAIGLGAEIGLDSVDFLENIKAVDKSVVMFTSYIGKDDNCIFQMIFL